ncbi:MAG: hypothetical protein WAK66_15225, partial [Methylocystis sp.]
YYPYYPYYYGQPAYQGQPVYRGQGVYYAHKRRYSSNCHNVTRSIMHRHQRYWRTVRVCHR